MLPLHDRVKRATSEILGLVQIGKTLDYELEALKEPILSTFTWMKPTTLAPLDEPDEAYDSRRNQFHSTRILAKLEQAIGSSKVDKLLGVTCLDLFHPGLNFVFGEARLPGRVGVISTSRLRIRRRKEHDLFEERITKEAIHEIGHMVGLEHCPDISCVMYFSNTLADTDYKGQTPCRRCNSKLSAKIEQ